MPGTVVHLIDTGGPGGAETIFLDMVTGLDPDRWRSVAVVPTRHWLHGALEEQGVEPIRIRSGRSFDAAYVARLCAVAREYRATLIHTHLLTTAVYGSAVGRLLRLPVVGTLHGTVDLPASDPLLPLKLRIVTRASNRIVFVSEALRRAILQRAPLPQDITRVVPNGIDLGRYSPVRDVSLRSELAVQPGEILIGAVGNVRPSKDYATLLRAAAWLREQGSDYRFVIVGDTGPRQLHEQLMALHAELGLGESVRFIGFRSDPACVLRNLDIHVLSSVQEGFSLTTVQAMACAIPVVATRCGGPEEIITHDQDGLLVPTSDPAALGRALALLAGDSALRARLGAAARRTAEERYALNSMIEGYESIYTELTAPAQPRRGPGLQPAIGV